MKQFLYVGGIPRCGTMATNFFLHLHDSCFMYTVMNGAHPPDSNFFDKLKQRHANRQYEGQHFSVPRWLSDPHGFEAFSQKKNTEWDMRTVFGLPIIGVREDFTVNYFLKAKQMEPDSTGGRRVRLVFPVRRNVERLFYSQYAMKLQDQHHVKDKADEFVKRLLQAFKDVEKALEEHPDDVLVTNIIDGANCEYECRRLCSWLGLDVSPMQEKWIEHKPPMNMYGQHVRRIVKEIEKTKFYKEHIE